jgi:hypothetical protein
MTKQEVMMRLCKLASYAGEKRFGSAYAHDCFCGNNPIQDKYFQFEEEVMEFIEKAVMDAVESAKKGEEDGH